MNALRDLREGFTVSQNILPCPPGRYNAGEDFSLGDVDASQPRREKRSFPVVIDVRTGEKGVT
jgi:hypothetical protein